VNLDVLGQVDRAAALEDALVELGVLVRDRRGIPQPDRLEHAATEGSEEHRVDEAFRAFVAIPDATRAELAAEGRA
jgi:hypothetical protein